MLRDTGKNVDGCAPSDCSRLEWALSLGKSGQAVSGDGCTAFPNTRIMAWNPNEAGRCRCTLEMTVT
jgi:hypothetical protein